jgi:hypothetical protein
MVFYSFENSYLTKVEKVSQKILMSREIDIVAYHGLF